ncbi:MAG: hypothetical protein U9N45_04875 [Gemmatimonadota bacterium]|nr:hypothetical protein [Gemmatimonadota bacterium]
MTETLQRVILTATKSTLAQTLPILIPMLGFGWLLHLCSGMLQRSAVKMFGLKAYLYLIGWPGTLVHELGHAVFCPLFGHRITAIRLFSLSTRKQQTGFVSHSYNGRNPYHLMGNFFISTGPLILGSVLIYLALRFLAGMPLSLDPTLVKGAASPAADIGQTGFPASFLLSLKTILKGIAIDLDWRDYRLYIAGYLTLSIGSSMTLSPDDLSSAASGLWVILLLIFAANLILAGFGLCSPNVAPLVPWAAVICVLLSIILALCALAAVGMSILNFIFRKS